MAARILIGAVALLFTVGGSTAGAKGTFTLWSVYLKVTGSDSTVTLSPTGQLVDADCPNNVCRFRYTAGTRVTLTAVPGSGSWFKGWQQLYTNRPTSCTGTRRFCTLAMDGTKYAKAVFSYVQLWTSSNDGGHIDVVGGTACGTRCYQFPYGAKATVWAVADFDHHFNRWTSTRCSTVIFRGCSFYMYDNTDVSAFFARNDGFGEDQGPLTFYVPFGADIKGTGTGTITGPRGLSCPAKCTTDYERGREVVVTATATEGSRFARWTGVCANAFASTCVFRSVPSPSGGGRHATAWFNR